MARLKSASLIEVEQTIMKVLWRKGEASVREITDELSQNKPTAYTTVQTMCKILDKKGYANFRKESRTFIYSAKISEQDAQQSALKSLLNQFFGGSSKLLTQHLMQQSDVDCEQFKSLQEKIDAKVKPADQIKD
jgi:BlaI family penicillinase repressor